MINFNQLRVFFHAAKYLSCTKAAEKLYITQPAVTAQLKQLEEACSLKLFKRKGRHIFLTDQGNTLYKYAVKVFEYEREIEDAIDEVEDKWAEVVSEISEVPVNPFKKDILIDLFGVAWMPFHVVEVEGDTVHLPGFAAG